MQACLLHKNQEGKTHPGLSYHTNDFHEFPQTLQSVHQHVYLKLPPSTNTLSLDTDTTTLNTLS